MKISSNCLIKLKKKGFLFKIGKFEFFFLKLEKLPKIWTQAGQYHDAFGGFSIGNAG